MRGCIYCEPKLQLSRGTTPLTDYIFASSTFMTIKQPSIFFRALILGAQGVFFNLFFLAYLVNPNAAHRFVGYLEEEACLTYTLCLEEMDKGRLPEWKNMPAPTIAMVSSTIRINTD
jgi:hypothetical protein